MQRIIIGAGAKSAAVLHHINTQWLNVFAEEDFPAQLAWVQTHEDQPPPALERAELFVWPRIKTQYTDSNSQLQAKLADTLKASSLAAPSQETMAHSRRLAYLQCQHYTSAPLQAWLHERATSERSEIYLVLDYGDSADTGALAALLVLVRQTQPNAQLFVSGFLPHDMHEHNAFQAAQLYATLLECHLASAAGIVFSRFDDNEDAYATCAHQLSNIAVCGAPNLGFDAESGWEFSVRGFLHTREFTLSSHRDNMQRFFARQMALELVRRLYGQEQSGEFLRLPEWIRQLFSDRKWFLHPDYLTLEGDLFEPEQPYRYSPIAMEWDMQAKIALARAQTEDDLALKIRLMHAHMQSVYAQHFRAQGVIGYYSVNKTRLEAMAARIIAQIETQLTLAWSKGDYNLLQIAEIVREINLLIENRLVLYQGNQTREESRINAVRLEEEALAQEWREAGVFDKRTLQKNFSSDKFVEKIKLAYLAETQHQSQQFATSLLQSVKTQLTQLQERIRLLGKDIQDNLNKYQHRRATLLERAFRLPEEARWAFATATNWQPYIPSGFNFSLEKLFEAVRQSFMAEMDMKKGMYGILETLENIDLIRIIGARIRREHALFEPQNFLSIENRYFWEVMPRRPLSEFTELYQDLIDLAAPFGRHIERRQVWLSPPFEGDYAMFSAFTEQLEAATPGSRLLTNQSMHALQLVYRQVQCTPIHELDNLEPAHAHYEKMLFAKTGAALSLLMHPLSQAPYPNYDSEFLQNPTSDDMRQALLEGELKALVQTNGEVYVMIGAHKVRLGNDFQDALKMGAARYRLLRHLNDSASYAPEAAAILANRLALLRRECLDGKEDLREASWQEAGRYMPWARLAAKLESAFQAA